MLPTTSPTKRGGTRKSGSTTQFCSSSMRAIHAKSCTDSQRRQRKASKLSRRRYSNSGRTWRSIMWDQQGHAVGTSPSHLVAAVFLDEVSARDAIADLKLAGVRANRIGVALSDEAKRIHS